MHLSGINVLKISMQIYDILTEDYVREFCERNGISRFALFGSVVRQDFGANSDIDVLVEFRPGSVPGLYFFDLQEQLAEKIGHPVDLNTPDSLSPYFRDDVLKNAQVLYDAAA